MEKLCLYCGTPFAPSKANHIFCCQKCARKHWLEKNKTGEQIAKKITRQRFIKICPCCGEKFDTPYRQAQRCPTCVEIDRHPRQLYDGPQSRDGILHCNKWHLEGKSVRAISNINFSTERSVVEALNTPLTEAEKAVIRNHFSPDRPGIKLPKGF